MAIENLVPRSAYNVYPRGFWWQMFTRMSLMFGLPMGVMGVTSLLLPSHERPVLPLAQALLRGASGGLIAGVLFGLLMTLFFRVMNAFVITAVYDGKPGLVEPPLPTQNFAYRLPCSWMKRPNLAVGGVLYIGAADLTFIPHKKNHEKDRQPIYLRNLSRLSLRLVPAVPTGLTKWLIKDPPPWVEVATPDGDAAYFLVPDPVRTLPRLKGCLEELGVTLVAADEPVKAG